MIFFLIISTERSKKGLKIEINISPTKKKEINISESGSKLKAGMW